MRRSEIFENFIKIAQEKGMIGNGQTPAKSKKMLEEHPRWDSLDVKDLQKLYGVKGDTPKDMQYEHNIMEIAHREPVIIAPSYDKINGLVENEIERQNIDLKIVYKNNNGQLTGKKYAQRDLLLSLVRVGNDLDIRGEEALRKLADVCLMQASGEMKKEAKYGGYGMGMSGLLGAIPSMPVIGGIAAALGVLYLQQHLDMFNQGFEKNHTQLIGEVDDMLQSSDSWGVGYQYKNEFLNMLQELKGKLENFYSLYQKDAAIINQFEKPKDAKELMQISQQSDSAKAVAAYHELESAFNDMLPYLQGVVKNFGSEGYKQRQIEEEGWISGLIDKVQVLHGGKGLIGDDFDDVARAIPPYIESIKGLVNVFRGAGQMSNDAKQQLTQAAEKSQEMFDGVGGATTEPAGVGENEVIPTSYQGGGAQQNHQAPSAVNEPQGADIDQMTQDLEKELGEFGAG